MKKPQPTNLAQKCFAVWTSRDGNTRLFARSTDDDWVDCRQQLRIQITTGWGLGGGRGRGRSNAIRGRSAVHFASWWQIFHSNCEKEKKNALIKGDDKSVLKLKTLILFKSDETKTFKNENVLFLVIFAQIWLKRRQIFQKYCQNRKGMDKKKKYFSGWKFWDRTYPIWTKIRHYRRFWRKMTPPTHQYRP